MKNSQQNVCCVSCFDGTGYFADCILIPKLRRINANYEQASQKNDEVYMLQCACNMLKCTCNMVKSLDT